MTIHSFKIQMLKLDISHLRLRDPNMRAVIFTQFLDQKACIEVAMKASGVQVFSLSSSTNPKQCDGFIRKFQSAETSGPAVFVVALRAGAVGITLTAASHIFLMEPCVDLTKEIQAAGRIHR
jgi:SNF2 family DNA or RNA helicase